MSFYKKANSLIHETSPYLLQHAYNPVNWFPFCKNSFEKAKQENKLILISIGYSACHWCHVMEKECFEDNGLAQLMNKNFINIKVDREERSDVDMLYMQAVQLMTGQGGWPLNCFVLPNGKPFFGGTYFNKSQWKHLLENISDLYLNEPERINTYANELTDGIKQNELIITASPKKKFITKNTIENSISKWKIRLDNLYGGQNKSPKFPLPSNYQFLLRYSALTEDAELLKHVNLTLTKMALGGIYDQIRGGFCRYSTDIIWKVPHFEKMLYDNAQLILLYCEAYTLTKNNLYKEIAIETLSFVENEWLDKKGCFYSAYDADSDGEEGKYYVWNELELKDLLVHNFDLFSKYFEINDKGYWENGNYIFIRSDNLVAIQLEFNLSKDDIKEKINDCKKILINEAKMRQKPGLDDKTITSWNAITCSAFAKAYLTFNDPKYKKIALNSIDFILKNLTQSNGNMYRTYKNGESKIDGFLDDYAFTIDALMNCYLITQDEFYLNKSYDLCKLTLKLFHNKESNFLFYTNNTSSDLIIKTTEISDNVMPSSNSQMAINLFFLGTYFDIKKWIKKSETMLALITEEFINYGSGYSNWGCLALHFSYPFKEIAIVGKNVNENLIELYKHGLTNTILAVNKNASNLPLLKNRYKQNKTLFYVCEGNKCKLPVNSITDLLNQLV